MVNKLWSQPAGYFWGGGGYVRQWFFFWPVMIPEICMDCMDSYSAEPFAWFIAENMTAFWVGKVFLEFMGSIKIGYIYLQVPSKLVYLPTFP